MASEEGAGEARSEGNSNSNGNNNGNNNGNGNGSRIEAEAEPSTSVLQTSQQQPQQRTSVTRPSSSPASSAGQIGMPSSSVPVAHPQNSASATAMTSTGNNAPAHPRRTTSIPGSSLHHSNALSSHSSIPPPGSTMARAAGTQTPTSSAHTAVQSPSPNVGSSAPPSQTRTISASGSILRRSNIGSGTPLPPSVSVSAASGSHLDAGSSTTRPFSNSSTAASSQNGSDTGPFTWRSATSATPSTSSATARPSVAAPAQTTAATTSPSSSSSAVPSMFGSYSGGPPSLFNYQTAQPRPASVNRSTANAGYWRAPALFSAHGNAASVLQRNAMTPTASPRTSTQTFSGSQRTQQGWGGGGTNSWDNADGRFQENSLLSFSWSIGDLSLLREEVECSPLPSEEGRSVSAGAGRSEVWTCHPVFGNGHWKLELIRTRASTQQEEPTLEEAADDAADADTITASPTTVLSVYLSSMLLDYGSPETTIPTTVTLGLRASTARNNSFSASTTRRGPWVWTHTAPHTFRREAEFLECPLPSLSEVLSNEDVAKANAMELFIQIGTGTQLTQVETEQQQPHARLPFHLPEATFAPDMGRALEGLFDCPHTSDVALLVRERGFVVPNDPEAGLSDTSGGGNDELEVVPWPVGAPCTAGEVPIEVVVRDRVIFAHCSVLRARSEYFRMMLDSGFAEAQGQDVEGESSSTGGGRKIRFLEIVDADYPTVQAFVRYLYTASIQFMDNEDVRSVALDDDWIMSHPRNIGTDEVRNGDGANSMTMPVWEWRSLAQVQETEDDESLSTYAPRHQDALENHSQQHQHRRSLSSQHSLGGNGSGQRPRSPVAGPNLASPVGSPPSRRPMTNDVAPTPNDHPRNYDRRRSANGRSGDSGHSTFTARLQSKAGTNLGTASASASFLSHLLSTDPHPHPSPPPSPVSSLAIYRLSHRYSQTCLVSWSSDHLLSHLDPTNAFNYLLATYLWPELHHPVRRFVLDHWSDVGATAQFGRSMDDVSRGQWGPEAGKAIRELMLHLSGPNNRKGAAGVASAMTTMTGGGAGGGTTTGNAASGNGTTTPNRS